MVKQASLAHLKCWPLWSLDDKLIPILAVVGHRGILLTRPRDRMLEIPLVLYHIRLEYPGRSPILLMGVTPALKWTRRYCPSVESLIFERYFPLMNVLHVDWLLIRHQFLSITASAEAARMLSPT